MEQAMQPWERCNYVLDLDTIIDEAELTRIRQDMFSRKPIVLNKNDPKKRHLVIGILLSKSLIGAPAGKTLR